MGQVVCEIVARPSFNGVGKEGFNITIRDNGEVLGIRCNIDRTANDYSAEGKYITLIKKSDLFLAMQAIQRIANDRHVVAHAISEVEKQRLESWVSFKFLDKCIDYPHTNTDMVDKPILDTFVLLDSLIRFNNLLRIT